MAPVASSWRGAQRDQPKSGERVDCSVSSCDMSRTSRYRPADADASPHQPSEAKTAKQEDSSGLDLSGEDRLRKRRWITAEPERLCLAPCGSPSTRWTKNSSDDAPPAGARPMSNGGDGGGWWGPPHMSRPQMRSREEKGRVEASGTIRQMLRRPRTCAGQANFRAETRRIILVRLSGKRSVPGRKEERQRLS